VTAHEGYASWFMRGRAHQKAGHPIEAMVCYRQALQSNAHSARAHFRLGEVLRELGDPAEARVVWQAGLAVNSGHLPILLALATEARGRGALDEAIGIYRRVLAINPAVPDATFGLGLAGIEQGDDSVYPQIARLVGMNVPSRLWNELAQTLARARPSDGRSRLLLAIASVRAGELPALLLACAAEEMVTLGLTEQARETLARAGSQGSMPDDPETLRRLALIAARLNSAHHWAERYASRCMALFGGGPPLHWPRRTAGTALRVGYLVAPGASLRIGDITIDTEIYLRSIVAAHARERIAATVCSIGEPLPLDRDHMLPPHVSVVRLDSVSDAAALAEADVDVLVDLVGLSAAVGPLLAQMPARTSWTYPELAWANVAPLIMHALPAPSGADEQALLQHRLGLEQALIAACTSARWFTDVGTRTSGELASAWRAAVAAHRSGAVETALEGYRDVLGEQPTYARGQYLLGVLLRDRGERADAVRAFTAAVEAAPAYLDARLALVDALRESQRLALAIAVCEEGLRHAPREVGLWRALGLVHLAQRDGEAARTAFKKAIALVPTHAMTHYNHGVALQMLRSDKPALRAYQRALALDPQLAAADFNCGVIFREQGKPERAIEAFERVLARDPKHVPAYNALADTLFDARRFGDWLQVFDRFEAQCPDAFPMLVVALQACQYRADFARLDQYLGRLRGDEFKAGSETELADCLEQLLFLLLYFDCEPETLLGLYKAYDAVARRVYGRRLALPEKRTPGRIRVGYLSGDLRNHVMGKMMWSALHGHDRARFELFFYTLSPVSDEWTERYRGLGDHFEVIAELPERDAAARIAGDELDILVDLSTNTRGSKPGILGLKPARVQITHIASAGPVGRSTIDFKLTDDYADLPEQQPFQLETCLAMSGCVYPYRHIAPATEHPFSRERLDIAREAVVIGAFVNPLKLSRRCLALWREVLERIPNALLAISPMSIELRGVYRRLLAAAGISDGRVRVLPQGRDDAENQARYHVIDFVLDTMPYGGVNGTLEALDMNVPVVTLVGRRHGERSTYSILANLGVMQTVAASGSEYVAIAVRLATDPTFKAEVKAAIRAGLERSPLVDMASHTRNLEDAYVRALEQRYPEALADPAMRGFPARDRNTGL